MRTVSKDEKRESLEERTTLGRKIEYARKAKGMTREGMGEHLGLTSARIFNIEKGVTTVPAFLLSRRCKVLGVTLDHLFDSKLDDPHLRAEQQRAHMFSEARIGFNLTVAELAEMADVTTAYIYRLESMGVEVIDERISTLCKQLAISGNELLAASLNKEKTFKRNPFVEIT